MFGIKHSATYLSSPASGLVAMGGYELAEPAGIDVSPLLHHTIRMNVGDTQCRKEQKGEILRGTIFNCSDGSDGSK